MSNRKANLNLSNAGKRKQKRNAVENQSNKSLKLEKLEENPEPLKEVMPNQPINDNENLELQNDSDKNSNGNAVNDKLPGIGDPQPPRDPVNGNENHESQDDSDENLNVNAMNNKLPGIGDLPPPPDPDVPNPIVEEVADLGNNEDSEIANPGPPQEDVAPKSPIKSDEKIEADDSVEKANDELPKTSDSERPENDEWEEKVKQLCKNYYLGGYCKRNKNNDQFYAKNFDGDEEYFVDNSGNKTYAHKTITVDNEQQQVEYPITLNNGKTVFIYKNGIPIYPENLNTKKIEFPKHPVTKKEIYLYNDDGTVNYPKNRSGDEFYKKDEEGNEEPLNGQYRTSSDKTEMYPKDKDGNEFYIRNNTYDIPAYIKFGDELKPYYARKANGDEFYPCEYKLIE